MTIECNEVDALLAEGDELSMNLAAKHAAGCEPCRATLETWNGISDVGRSLHAEWPSDMLWPRIRRALAREQRPSRARVWQIAAAVAFFVAVGAVAWYAQRRVREDEFNHAILRNAALEEVERAEAAHVAAIDHLEKVAEPKLETADSPLMVNYREKLMLLDDAIAECRRGVDTNPQNAHLRRQLLTLYGDKQRTLQDVVREETHDSR